MDFSGSYWQSRRPSTVSRLWPSGCMGPGLGGSSVRSPGSHLQVLPHAVSKLLEQLAPGTETSKLSEND